MSNEDLPLCDVTTVMNKKYVWFYETDRSITSNHKDTY